MDHDGRYISYIESGILDMSYFMLLLLVFKPILGNPPRASTIAGEAPIQSSF